MSKLQPDSTAEAYAHQFIELARNLKGAAHLSHKDFEHALGMFETMIAAYRQSPKFRKVRGNVRYSGEAEFY